MTFHEVHLRVKMSEARCPGSCGELMQGWILGSEKLISCPINWYSTVAIENGKSNRFPDRPHMRTALRKTLKHLEIPEKFSDTLTIRHQSTLPVAKGMASSTADIAATILATARHFDYQISDHEIAKICTDIEPTDSTIFNKITLFDHNLGTTHAQFDWVPELDILILENHESLETSAYHRMDRESILRCHEAQLSRAYKLFHAGMSEKNLQKIGDAASMSAIASQSILEKKNFDGLLKFVEKYQLLGLNVAHSGTVIGLLLDKHKSDLEEIQAEFCHSSIARHYPKQHHAKLIAGGVE